MDALRRPRPRAKCSFSWWSMSALMKASFSSISPSIVIPRTTAPTTTGRICSNSGSTVIEMSPFITSKLGSLSTPCKNGRMAFVSVSPDNKSGRSGNISISRTFSSQVSMSVPRSGNCSSITATSCTRPCFARRPRMRFCSTEIVGIVSTQRENQCGNGRSYPTSRSPLIAAVS